MWKGFINFSRNRIFFGINNLLIDFSHVHPGVHGWWGEEKGDPELYEHAKGNRPDCQPRKPDCREDQPTVFCTGHWDWQCECIRFNWFDLFSLIDQYFRNLWRKTRTIYYTISVAISADAIVLNISKSCLIVNSCLPDQILIYSKEINTLSAE